MCGINGVLRLHEAAPPLDRDELRRTRDAMAKRGPDGCGEWFSSCGRLALGHRRLAILDPSPAGAQPMISSDRRLAIVLNGEIYNFRELRRELERDGVSFRSESDTEVLLALYARQGDAMLGRLRGMFALALWDTQRKRLLLARDPLGIKPLYYAVASSAASPNGDTLRFASQVRALEACGRVSSEVSIAGLVGFLLWGTVPEPHTLRRAIRALPAGHLLAVEDGRVGEPIAYSTGDASDSPQPDTVAAALEDSVRAHLVSDVPVAVFLSAGIDSTLIAALAQRLVAVRGETAAPLTTFTLTFDTQSGTSLDEAPLARRTARTLGTRHVERQLGKADLRDLWPQAIAAMDQPSIDGFNVFAVSRVAHEEGLKVVLSGLGGDELFGSYPSFRDVPRLVRWSRRGGALPGARVVWPDIAESLWPQRPKLAAALDLGTTLPGAYFLRRGLFLPQDLPRLLGREAAEQGLAEYDPLRATALALVDGNGSLDGWLAVQRMETTQYLRNQLLRDADWAAMAHSVELRVPFVDVKLNHWLAARDFEPFRSRGKAAVAREILPALPAVLFRRRKQGFYIPLPEWTMNNGNPPDTHGLGSRELAIRVLREFGVDARG